MWSAHFLSMHGSVSDSDCIAGIPWRVSELLVDECFLLSAQIVPSSGSGKPCLSTRYVLYERENFGNPTNRRRPSLGLIARLQRRAKFRPNLYHRTAFDSTPNLSQTRSPARRFITRAFTFPTGPRPRDTPHDLHHNSSHDQDYGYGNASELDTNKRVLEVWFAGSHSGRLTFFILGRT